MASGPFYILLMSEGLTKSDGHNGYQALLSSSPTAIRTKSVIDDKQQETRERVEMDFSITALLIEMNFSEYNIMKWVEMDFSMTTQEPVELV
jgi:hypothetical protein